MQAASRHGIAPVVILLGPPGAGKGTQARLLEDRFGLVQLSTGDLLRGAVAEGSPAGRAAQAVMAAGGLVGDHIVLEVLRTRLGGAGLEGGVILDGFPRTAAQARALDAMLADAGAGIDAVISLEVDDAAMIDRVAGRYACAGCGEGYHDTFRQPAQPGTCDRCGGTGFSRRADDTAETARARLAAYHAQTAPLIAYYADRGVLTRIDAQGDIPGISAALQTVVAGLSA